MTKAEIKQNTKNIYLFLDFFIDSLFDLSQAESLFSLEFLENPTCFLSTSKTII